MNLSFPKIITGGSLESLFYAYMTETPIVICQPYIPFELETVEYHEMFDFLGYTTNRPITKVELWDRLAFVLSMAGMIMMPNNIRNIRHRNNKIMFALQDNSRFEIEYKEMISFDKHTNRALMVYDWFDIKSGSLVELKNIVDTKNKMVKEIIFYDSTRRGNGGKGHKDLVAVSKIPEKRLLDYESSESLVRLKTLKMMKEAGLRGQANGYNSRGTALFYAIKIEHTHRELIKTYIPKHTMEETFQLAKEKKEIWNLTKKLLHRKQISTLRASSRLQVVV